jgi:uncharacterized membrane protein YoaK (UPF0700 family)
VALGVAVALALVTGFVDAVAFARLVGVFPANQSGNLLFFGMAIGGRPGPSGWHNAIAIGGYVVGVTLAFAAGRRLQRPRRGPALLAVELALLAAVIVIAGPIDGSQLRGGAQCAALIALLSVAMGVQTEVISRVAGIMVATTYETGAITRAGETVTRLLRRDGTMARVDRQFAVLFFVVAAYVGGATVGVSALGEWRWALVIPCAVLAALAACWLALPERFPGGAGDE